MKRLYLVLAGLLFVAVASAQNATTYFMEGSQFRMQWNPAFAPDRGYITVPVFGNVQANINGNVSLDEFIFPQNGELYSIFNGAVPASVALEGLEEINKLDADVRLGNIGFGAYTKNRRNFWSFEMAMRTTAGTEVPYSLFEFMKNGTSADISGLNFGLGMYMEGAFSYSMPLTDKLVVGARAKIVMGMARMNFEFEQFDAVMGEDKWYADAVGRMEISGLVPPVSYNDNGDSVYNLDDLEFDSMKVPAGWGLGIDLGVTYDLLPNLQLSASVNDLGFMKWSKSSTAVGQIAESIEFEGVVIDEQGNVMEPEFDLDELEFKVVDSEGKAQSLYTSFNVGGQYSILDNRIGFGLFYSGKLGTYKTFHNVTASANFRPLEWLHLSGSYSFIDNKASAVGLGLNICPGFINLVVATDILLSKKTPQWIPIKQSNMSFTFGLGVPLGKRGERK